jgi:hypothetical protein
MIFFSPFLSLDRFVGLEPDLGVFSYGRMRLDLGVFLYGRMRIRSLLISLDFDCFRVLFVVRFSKWNCLFLHTAANSMETIIFIMSYFYFYLYSF